MMKIAASMIIIVLFLLRNCTDQGIIRFIDFTFVNE